MYTKIANKRDQAVFSPVFFIFCMVMGLVFSEPVRAGGTAKIKTIRIATPEWQDQTNADGTGLFFDIVRAVYDPAGIQMTWQFVPWKRAQVLVNQGKADAMLCVWKDDAEREGLTIPAWPMYVEHTAVVYKRESIPTWQGVHTLDYKRAVWLRGYDYHLSDALKSVQFGLWHEVDTHENAWHQLDLDRFDFYIDALIDLDIYIREKQIDMSLYHRKILWSQPAYMAFSTSERCKRLIRIYDARIRKLFQSGALEKIYKKWHQTFDGQYWEARYGL